MEVNKINSTHPGNPVNDPHVQTPNRRSKFDLDYILAQTMRFGELTPHFVAECIPDDVIPVHCGHKLSTFTLKAPLQQDISIKKDYFNVPMMALLPFNWDKIYTQPNIGDDVPLGAYSAIYAPIEKLAEFFDNYILTRDDTSEKTLCQWLCDLMINLEYFFSSGCLINTLGRNFTRRINCGPNAKNFDDLFDKFCSDVFGANKITQITLQDVNSTTYVFDGSSEFMPNLHKFLEDYRDNGTLPIASVSGTNAKTVLETFIDNNICTVDDESEITPIIYFETDVEDRPFDMARCLAYQMVCSHFYSNDSVDYIYSAELFRQNVKSLLDAYNEVDSITFSFSYNGVNIPYDYLSGHFFESLVLGGAPAGYSLIFNYFSLLFAFRHSLRFVDYFTGAKTRPLAIGDVSVAVTDSSVSVVDVTRNIQLQRFLNAVNRTGRKISNYVKGLFGTDMQPDFHDPLYLGHTTDSLFSDETQNTGAAQFSAQQSVSTVLRSNADKFAFEVSCDRPGVVIGITYFDLPRLYSDASDRQTFHKDRFDMFNPFMEFIGDQPVFESEITSLPTDVGPGQFGYQTRYMEYKQRINRAVGGFVDHLPGYVFLADKVNGLNIERVISPAYIRSSNVELDAFYVSLTGNCYSSYFHFQVINYITSPASRPMSYSPNIL